MQRKVNRPDPVNVLDGESNVWQGDGHGGGLLAQLLDVVRLVEYDDTVVEVKVQCFARFFIYKIFSGGIFHAFVLCDFP